MSSLFSHLLILTHPVDQLSLWEEIGEPGENPRLSAECWRTLPMCDQIFDTRARELDLGGGEIVA